MKVGSPNGSQSGDNQTNIPIDRMLTTAGKMISNAKSAQTQHEQTWKRIQNYINTFPGFMQGPVQAVLSAYEKRLRDSYQWQIDCANALLNAALAAGATENQIVHDFDTAANSTPPGKNRNGA